MQLFTIFHKPPFDQFLFTISSLVDLNVIPIFDPIGTIFSPCNVEFLSISIFECIACQVKGFISEPI